MSANGAAIVAWPTQPIRLVVPLPEGGDADGLAAPLAAALGRELGQPVVLDHRPGIGGNLGAEMVAKSAPDGYTFLLGSVEQVIAASVQPPPGYDLQRDLVPVTLVALAPHVLVVSAAQDAVSTIEHLIRRQRSDPASASYASSGTSVSHLAAQLYRQATATTPAQRVYRGTPTALEDVRTGQVDFMIVALDLALPSLRSGRLRPLAVTSGSRSFALPAVPTLAEAGVSGVRMLAWHALWSPAGTPAAVNLAMQQAVAAVLDRKEMVDTWNSMGAERGGQPEPVLELLIRSELLSWGRLVKTLEIGPKR